MPKKTNSCLTKSLRAARGSPVRQSLAMRACRLLTSLLLLSSVPAWFGRPHALAPLATSAHAQAHPSRFQPALLARPDVKQALDSIDARATAIVDEWVTVVEIPAPSKKEQARAAYITAELKKLTVTDIRTDDLGNVSAVRKGTGGGPTIVFAAHMDTVFPEGTDVTVKRDGDVLRGPGIGDDTSNLVAQLEMFRALDRGRIATKGDLIFLATVQEEIGLVGARHWLETSGYSPDMFIAVDVGSDEVWYGALRITQYKFFYTSAGAHTLESRGGPSPAKAVSQGIAAVNEIPLPPVQAGLGSFKVPVINVGMLGGGTVFNAVPREAWFTVDLRSLDTPTQSRLEKEVEAAARRVADREKVGFRMEKTTFIEYSKARPRDERLHHELVQTAVATANHFRTPGTPAIVPVDIGSTDANAGIALGIPSIAIGAVIQRSAHQLEENADASSIVPGLKHLIALAVALGR
jgi:acetylornithine deacetylase/succinyl-diaminopimelate desuccinylase-like protein